MRQGFLSYSLYGMKLFTESIIKMFYRTDYNSPIGVITLGADENNIVGLWMKGQKYFGDTVKGEMSPKDDLAVFQKAKNWLDRYFQGQKPAISELPLAPIGGEFRQTVWKILCEIPYGQVITYGDIAKKIAQRKGLVRMSAQAVGGAVGHNPISLIIPCHRVVGTNGNLTGYSGGLDMKIKLLEFEGVNMSKLYRPKKGTAL